MYGNSYYPQPTTGQNQSGDTWYLGAASQDKRRLVESQGGYSCGTTVPSQSSWGRESCSQSAELPSHIRPMSHAVSASSMNSQINSVSNTGQSRFDDMLVAKRHNDIDSSLKSISSDLVELKKYNENEGQELRNYRAKIESLEQKMHTSQEMLKDIVETISLLKQYSVDDNLRKKRLCDENTGMINHSALDKTMLNDQNARCQIAKNNSSCSAVSTTVTKKKKGKQKAHRSTHNRATSSPASPPAPRLATRTLTRSRTKGNVSSTSTPTSNVESGHCLSVQSSKHTLNEEEWVLDSPEVSQPSANATYSTTTATTTTTRVTTKEYVSVSQYLTRKRSMKSVRCITSPANPSTNPTIIQSLTDRTHHHVHCSPSIGSSKTATDSMSMYPQVRAGGTAVEVEEDDMFRML